MLILNVDIIHDMWSIIYLQHSEYQMALWVRILDFFCWIKYIFAKRKEMNFTVFVASWD